MNEFENMIAKIPPDTVEPLIILKKDDNIDMGIILIRAIISRDSIRIWYQMIYGRNVSFNSHIVKKKTKLDFS